MDEKSFERELLFDGSTVARGRNGYFHLMHGRVLTSATMHKTWIELASRRQGDTPPIELIVAQTSDLRQIGLALLAAADALDGISAPDSKQPCPESMTCPACGSEDLTLAVDETNFYCVYELNPAKVVGKYKHTESMQDDNPLGNIRLFCTDCVTYFDPPAEYEVIG